MLIILLIKFLAFLFQIIHGLHLGSVCWGPESSVQRICL
uniref:Uncharacterized protein n=1 Tax=Arundo donax TaxID=35708 RepID=A0A0A9GBV5_ARUDO